jgi:hypothetical protein
MKKQITIKDFKIQESDDMVYIMWDDILKVMGPLLYLEFTKFMNGQTCFKSGAYKCDVENFLRKPQNRFFD